jgi:hypothetical protein
MPHLRTGKNQHSVVRSWPHSFVKAPGSGGILWTASWIAVRLRLGDDLAAVIAGQLRDVIGRLMAAGHWRAGVIVPGRYTWAILMSSPSMSSPRVRRMLLARAPLTSSPGGRWPETTACPTRRRCPRRIPVPAPGCGLSTRASRLGAGRSPTASGQGLCGGVVIGSGESPANGRFTVWPPSLSPSPRTPHGREDCRRWDLRRRDGCVGARSTRRAAGHGRPARFVPRRRRCRRRRR